MNSFKIAVILHVLFLIKQLFLFHKVQTGPIKELSNRKVLLVKPIINVSTMEINNTNWLPNVRQNIIYGYFIELRLSAILHWVTGRF